jgi:large subunit ribosomal protein L17
MRHLKKINHLSRKSAHRNAMLANMTCSLIKHKSIITTVAKAKALKKYAEPIFTRAKIDNTHSRRIVFSYLQNKDAVTELFRNVAVKIADRPGGYTRILKLGTRKGDNAEICKIELVDYNELMLYNTEEKKIKTSRRGSKSKKKITDINAPSEISVDENNNTISDDNPPSDNQTQNTENIPQDEITQNDNIEIPDNSENIDEKHNL